MKITLQAPTPGKKLAKPHFKKASWALWYTSVTPTYMGGTGKKISIRGKPLGKSL
jgi:hypothetical protein